MEKIVGGGGGGGGGAEYNVRLRNVGGGGANAYLFKYSNAN